MLAAVITVSDRSAAGEREDAAGPAIERALADAGFQPTRSIVADGADSVAGALRAAIGQGARLVITTGGTGVGPRDRTPEGTRAVLDREVPGIAEELRRIGASETPGGMLSRGVAGVVDGSPEASGRALIVNLPGSPKAVASGMPVILSVAAHVLDQLGGGDHS